MNRVMNIIDTLKYRARRVFKSKTAVTAVALSFAFIGVVFASVIVPLMSEMPSDNPWDYAMVTFGDGESLICSSYTMSVYGDIRSNGGIQLSGRGMYVSGMAVARGNITSTTALGDKRENSGQIVHNDVFNNIHTLAGGKTTHSNKVIYSMQNDPNIDSIRNNISIPFLRTAGSSDTGFAVNPDTRAVTVTNRGGTSQGIQVIAADINAVVKSNHSYRIEFSGNFPNNPTATARIRVENPTGATLATADAVNGRFTLSAVLTAEQILSDAQAGIRYSLGNVSGNIDIVYTRIVVIELPPVSSVLYSMQTDTNLSDMNNNDSRIPFLQGAGGADTVFTPNTDSNPKTVAVTNRGGTSQGIRVVAADIGAIAKPNHSYEISFSGRFPNNPSATARIRLDNPTAETLATAEAVGGEFTLSVTRTSEQIAADAQAGHHYSLGNTSGNIDIVYTSITITEIPPITVKPAIYDMQTDSNLSNLKGSSSKIPFLQSSGSSGTTFTPDMNATPRTVTVTNRGGTSQGIRVVAADINAIAKPNHTYTIEYSGRFPNNPDATARIRLDNPTSDTLAMVDAVDGEFTLSVTRTAEQIAADAQVGHHYSLGNTTGNIDIVYTGIRITESSVLQLSGDSVRLNENIISDSAVKITSTENYFGTVIVDGYLLSDSDIVIYTNNFHGGESEMSVIASRNGDITINTYDSNFSGVIYAPNGRVTINGAGLFNGRIFAHEIMIISESFTIIAGDYDISYLGFTTPHSDEPEDTTSVTTPTTDNSEPTTTPTTDDVPTSATSGAEPTTPTNPTTPVTTENSPFTTAPDDDIPPGYSDVAYEYDRLGRLIRVTYDEDNYIVYEYDANGNITKVTRVIDGAIQE